jgi:BirA family biotin operon repressor/biotin-[acetyl-CoA-carboxylase] ligase
MMALVNPCYNSAVSTRKQILKLLSDERFHSGTEIGEQLGISRAAVHKAIKSLVQNGIEVHSVSGRGYRLTEPHHPLSRSGILRRLSQLSGDYSNRLHLLEEVDSTSNYLNALAATDNTSGMVCVAESQSGGRGRRGRSWVATPYSNIMMSMAWQYERGPTVAAGLSLAAGVTIIESLVEFGVAGAGVKWPNDILWDDKKLAGVLMDVQGEVNGPTRVTLGLGVNVYIGDRDAGQIDQPWIDLMSITDNSVDRNHLIAILIHRLESMFREYEQSGLDGFIDRWHQAHVYHGKPVRIIRGNEVLEGIVAGIDESGAIRLLDAAGNLQSYHSGEISLRAGNDGPAN